MQYSNSIYTYQSAFADYCRTGNLAEVRGVESERVSRYRELVINVVSGSLASAFPLTKNLLSAKEWNGVINEFFGSYRCQSPQVWKMPGELLQYMDDVRHSLFLEYPMLKELLTFEWAEVEMYMQEDVHVEYTVDGNENTGLLILNPEMSLHKFDYPVYLKPASDVREGDKSEYYLSIHRHPSSGKVYFTNLSQAFAFLINQLMESPLSLEQLFETVSVRFQLNKDEVLNPIKEFVLNSLKRKLILGYHK